MIVLADKYGRLGNRLAYLRVFLSFGLEHGVNVLDLSFDEYKGYFKGGGDVIWLNGVCSTLLRKMLRLAAWARLLGPGNPLLSVLKADAEDELRLVDPATALRCREDNVVILGGWPVIDWNVVRRHDDRIRAIFTPADAVAAKVACFIEEARKERGLLVGVHMRQGDYKYWQDGRHYLESAQYAGIMAKIRDGREGVRVRFVIASDEVQDWDLFADFDYVKAPGTPVEDLYVLAQCDEIYGPQSSFSAWASFFGDVPLYRIDSADGIVRA